MQYTLKWPLAWPKTYLFFCVPHLDLSWPWLFPTYFDASLILTCLLTCIMMWLLNSVMMTSYYSIFLDATFQLNLTRSDFTQIAFEMTWFHMMQLLLLYILTSPQLYSVGCDLWHDTQIQLSKSGKVRPRMVKKIKFSVTEAQLQNKVKLTKVTFKWGQLEKD